MERRIPAADLRTRLDEIMAMVEEGDRIIIERSGHPFAALVSFEWYEDTVDADILAAVKEVRAMGRLDNDAKPA